MIMKLMKRSVRTILGPRGVQFVIDYSPLPRAVILESKRILRLIELRRKYRCDDVVLMCHARKWGHIVDKGLQADNWEPGHGKVPYNGLCETIESLEGTPQTQDISFRWAVEKKQEFETSQELGVATYTVEQEEASRIASADLLHLIRSRRSVRSFEDRKIDDESIAQLADVMNWAPTSCNRQPARLFITQNPEKVKTSLRQCAGATCMGEHVPCFISVCADSRFYMVKDRNVPLIDVSLGIQNLLLLAHAKGIGVTPLNWMHHTKQEDERLREALGIPPYNLIVLNLALGYPTKSAPAPARKSRAATFTIVE